MTESEWLSSVRPHSMLCFLNGKTSDRKLRLFACACCRAKWDLITDPRSRAAVVTTEQFVDGRASLRQWSRVRCPALSARSTFDRIAQKAAYYAASAAFYVTLDEAHSAAGRSMFKILDILSPVYSPSDARREEEARLCGLLPDIIGNPFQPVSIYPRCSVDPSFFVGDVWTIAQEINENSAFDRMPVLGETLKKAGCSNSRILEHCQERSHVRGCYVLDLALGKA